MYLYIYIKMDGHDNLSGLEHAFTFQFKIGEGSYGKVFKAVKLESNQVVAIKVIEIDLDFDGIPSTTLREIIILKKLDHVNIVK